MKNNVKKFFIMFVIIFILIICFSIMFDKIGFIKKEKQIQKEMSSTSKEVELNTQLTEVTKSSTEYANYIQTCKTKIATALTNEGVTTSEQTTLETMSDNISKVLQERTKDATATADNITQGKTAYVNGIQITGNGNDINSSKQEVCNKVYNALQENEVSPSSSSLEDILTAISTIKNGSDSGVVTVSGTVTAVINMNTGRTYCQTSSTFTVNININDGEITYSVDGGNATASSWVDISDLYGSILCTKITGVSIKSVTYSET